MKRYLLLLLLLPLLGSSCRDGAGRRPEDIALVELIPKGADEATNPLGLISVADYREALARMRLERDDTIYAEPLPKELEDVVLERLIERRMVALEAERLGVAASTTAVAREIASMKRDLPKAQFQRHLLQTYQTEADLAAAIEERLVMAELFATQAHAKVKVTDEELKEAWQKTPDDARRRPARVHAAQIVLGNEEGARKVLKQLRKRPPADFSELARRESIAPEASRGGDLGWFEMGTMPAVFDEVCFTLDVGEISNVTPSELGFHIFKVLEREDARALTFEEAKPELLDTLRTKRLRAAEKAYLKELASRYRVHRHEDRLKQETGS